ncbi:MAG: HD family phosphohydrolase, partial [Butyricimonas faecihominis]
MPNNKTKKHRTIQYVFKISTIIIICGLIVLLLPKIEGFKYSYQKGMPWKYETLIAPLDFPLHKSAEELTADIEKIKEEQAPIFNFKETNIEAQINKLSEKINTYRTANNGKDMDKIIQKLREIYSKGILLMPEKMDPAKIKNILIVKNNIAFDEKFSNVYTLKQAYETLVKYIESLHLSKSTEEGILSLGLNNYINPNLEYDAGKTGLAIETSVKSITPTQGMVNRGDIIISQNDLVTPEKYKVLESFRIEHEQSLGSTIDRIRISVAQTVLTLIAIMSFSIFLYVSRKRLFYNNRDFFFLYSMFLLTIALGSISYFQHINILMIPVLFFPIIVNILFGTRPALYLLIGTSLLVSYYAPNNYMYFFMQISAGIVAMFSLSHLQRRSQLFIALGLIFLTYILVYGAFTLIQEGTLAPKHLFAVVFLIINTGLLSLIYPALYLVERLFGYTSEISLLEYSNPNHPALRNLTKKAPGTFQHSLMVANLAEEAIYHIGGSPLLARTGALYHDIGKTYNPIMFVENQTGGLNPHDSLDFDESAQIIIKHVTQGLELANKYKLPEVLKDFIRTHHGK